ncbi:THUMP domain-containing protein [Nitrosovibrio tenuis]|uniref:THUMP domain-containing protein n=1 Tax=Nitrosovibrio tenuis TaxID=1233 RepID=UPI001C435406|nr:THUMP domain-containing protein [Nitrosovibrio tenuis]
MGSWNVIVTVAPGPGRESRLLRQLRRLGYFKPTEFKNVCSGHVEDTAQFLEGLRAARENQEPWLSDLGRVIPVEQTFSFTPETLTGQLKQAMIPLVARMTEGTFHVRLERRGLPGQVMSQEVERQVGEHLQALAEAAGKRLQVSFAHADYVVAVETIGTRCGIALLDRTFRERFPFVLPH